MRVRLQRELLNTNDGASVQFIESPYASREELATTHCPEYIDRFLTGSPFFIRQIMDWSENKIVPWYRRFSTNYTDALHRERWKYWFDSFLHSVIPNLLQYRSLSHKASWQSLKIEKSVFRGVPQACEGLLAVSVRASSDWQWMFAATINERLSTIIKYSNDKSTQPFFTSATALPRRHCGRNEGCVRVVEHSCWPPGWRNSPCIQRCSAAIDLICCCDPNPYPLCLALTCLDLPWLENHTAVHTSQINHMLCHAMLGYEGWRWFK